MRPRPLFLAAAILLSAALPARAFNLLGTAWPAGDIVMHLQLGQPPSPLIDGATDWNAVAQAALDEWNAQIVRARFTSVPNSTAEIRRGNRTNNVAFRADIYGTAFDSRTLAVTIGASSTSTGLFTEQDVLFNSNLTWNSYRGSLRAGSPDLRRVALHEFGHVLGLDHPDEAEPVQNVAAIMNSTISSLESLQTDDVNGIRVLYAAGTGVLPVITAQPQSRTVRVGESFTLAVNVGAGSAPLTYSWFFRAAGTTTLQRFSLAEGPSYTIGSVQAADAGEYSVGVTSPSGGTAVSTAAVLTVQPVATSQDTLLTNLSTRAVVGTGSDVMIAGFVVGGTTSKNIFIRAAGPALAGFGVAGALANPTLRLVNGSGATVAENDDWDAAGAGTPLVAAANRLGGFAFPRGSRDAAILTTLVPGSYTAVVSGVGNTGGIALVEAYDADVDLATSRTRRLVNIATRGRVTGGDNLLIAGLVVTGPGPRTFLIRAIGPTLGRAPFNLAGAMLDPFLRIYRGATLLRENDDWDTPASAQTALREAATKVGAFALMETRDLVLRSGLDSAMLITLEPGSYTAQVSGFEGSTGIALVEIYEVP